MKHLLSKKEGERYEDCSGKKNSFTNKRPIHRMGMHESVGRGLSSASREKEARPAGIEPKGQRGQHVASN